jgi:putative acyl-CoA dehydrogenase
MQAAPPVPDTAADVANQPPPLAGYDVFGNDAALAEGLRREGAAWAVDELHDLGRLAGSEEAIGWGFDANRFGPILRTHDRYGRRVDEVEFHPSYHRLMEVAVSRGLHGTAWRDPRAGAHVARAAAFVVWAQVDAGHGCPISMTYAAVPALRAQADVARDWEPLLAARSYDPMLRPVEAKGSALCGMGMTEKQGGSDVRTNQTRAEPLGASGSGETYLLSGHKWFCSAPMCDAFLVLAQAPEGLSCFLLPRMLPDGSRNVFRIQRLKDKLGNRSNASSEVEFERTIAAMIGEPGRGVQTIIAMVNQTRLDCIAGSAAGMRQAVAQATHHAGYRTAFGRLLIDQPLMRNVLADLALESEAATALLLRLARACDGAQRDEREAHLLRIGTAVGKYWVCKRAAAHAAEALECLGGNGYVEESIMPRLYREAPLNSIWEGSGNVNALDTLRAMKKTPGAIEAYFSEVRLAAGADRLLDAAVVRLARDLADDADVEARARRIVEQLAMVLQGSLLVRCSPPPVAHAFCASRLGSDWGVAFGTLAADVDFGAIIERARPLIA